MYKYAGVSVVVGDAVVLPLHAMKAMVISAQG